MTASDDLFQLIKSLNQSEKRYFKMFASVNIKGKDSICLKLFDAIDKQARRTDGEEKYDEKVLKEKFKGERFMKQLTATKYHLTSLLLKSLRSYHSNASANDQANHLLLNIGILFNKGLYDLCSKQINRLKELAIEYELYAQYMDALRWEKEIMLKQQFSAQKAVDIEKMIEEEKNILLKLQNTGHYRNLSVRWWYLIYKKGKSRDASDSKYYDAIANDPFIKNEQNAITKKSKYSFYILKAAIANENGDFKQSLKNRKQLIDFIERSPDEISKSPTIFIAAVFNLAKGLFYIGRYQEALSTLEKTDNIKKLKLNYFDRLSIFSETLINKTAIYNETNAFEKTIALIPELELGIKGFNHYVNTKGYLIIVYNICYAYTAMGKYKNALKWLNKILNSKETIAIDVHCYARIINLIIHFEMKDEELLTYITKSTYQYLYRKNRLYKIESSVLNFIKKTSKLNAKKEFITAFKELRKELIKLSQDPYEAKAFEYFDFISWLDSKIENRAFAEIIKKNANTGLILKH